MDVLLLIPRRHLLQLKQRHCVALLNPGAEVFVHLGVDFASQRFNELLLYFVCLRPAFFLHILSIGFAEIHEIWVKVFRHHLLRRQIHGVPQRVVGVVVVLRGARVLLSRVQAGLHVCVEGGGGGVSEIA